MTSPSLILVIRYAAVLAAMLILGYWLPEVWLCLPLFFFPGCECCEACDVFYSDSYATDTIATNYAVSAGSWSVSGGTLRTSSDDALILSNALPTSGVSSVRVQVVASSATAGDVAKIVAGYVDANNYWYGEFSPGASNGTLKLFEVSGGVTTQHRATHEVYNATAAASLCLSLQSGAVHLAASVGGFFGFPRTSISVAASPTIAGTKAGVGTGSIAVGPAQFDDYDFANIICQECITACSLCESDFVPDELDVEITGLVSQSGCVATCDGPWTFTLQRFQGLGTGSSCLWRIAVATPICCVNSGGEITLNGDITAFLSNESGTYVMYLNWTGPIGYFFQWRAELGTDLLDCESFSEIELEPYDEGVACLRCDFSSSIATVSAA